ncbi:MAG: hypothetical protein PF482_13730 [Desulfobacteraceae bacterium]|jgi:hypothetical protein|nr:hypothetical protein [Desulfobacteraceae bacterium]
MPERGSFLLRIQKNRMSVHESSGVMNILVRRPHSYMVDELRKLYEDQDQVNIIVDRRYGIRRQKFKSVNNDCRSIERRSSVERNTKMNLIVKRPYSYLTEDLQRVFEGQEDVNIVVDSRHEGNDQRKEDQSIPDCQRICDRRKTNETVLDVIISY